MLNNVVLVGRITKDPELKIIGKNETKVTNFDIAVDNQRVDENGERGTSFFSVVCFNNIAENVVKHLMKGSKIGVVGSIEQRNFLKKDGSAGTKYEVIASTIEFLDSKKQDEEAKEPKAEPEQKFDPYTGKPISKSTKK